MRLVNSYPIAVASATDVIGTTPLPVALSAAGSYDPDGTIVAYLWDFGDAQTASGSLVAHVLTAQSESRVYTVVLTVMDDGGATDTAALNISVLPAP